MVKKHLMPAHFDSSSFLHHIIRQNWTKRWHERKNYKNKLSQLNHPLLICEKNLKNKIKIMFHISINAIQNRTYGDVIISVRLAILVYLRE